MPLIAALDFGNCNKSCLNKSHTTYPYEQPQNTCTTYPYEQPHNTGAVKFKTPF